MTPTPTNEPGDAMVSTEAEWGLRALIMVLLVFLRWAGRDLSTTPSTEATTGSAPEMIAATPTGSPRHRPAPVASESLDPELVSSSARRRTAFASAVAVAGTAAWIAGRRSAGRPT